MEVLIPNIAVEMPGEILQRGIGGCWVPVLVGCAQSVPDTRACVAEHWYSVKIDGPTKSSEAWFRSTDLCVVNPTR